MAAYMEIVKKQFPSLDSDLSQYVESVLDGGEEEFKSGDDVFDAVGELLHNVSNKTEQEVRDICVQMMKLMNINGIVSNQSSMVMLDAPVKISQIVENQFKHAKSESTMWSTRKCENALIDPSKLGMDIKKKQKFEKKQAKEQIISTVAKTSDTASASQSTSRRDNKMDSAGVNKTYDVHLENFDIAYGEKSLLEGATLHMSRMRRYGLVGRNGLGKTTLLRMISTGDLKIPSHLTVLHVEQEVAGDDTPALQSVLESNLKLFQLMTEEKKLNMKLHSNSATDDTGDIGSRLSKIYAELEEMEAEKAPSRASLILCGLGFTPEMQKQTTKEFSGGWRMRLALARALFTKPDLLLLDEPTNMLDVKAILWLENYVQNWPNTIFVVSHDKGFLNRVSTDVVHLNSKRLDQYRGNYENFIKTRKEKLINQQKEYESQLQYRQHIQIFIDRFRFNANRASQVQSKLKLLEKLPELKPIEKESEVTLKFPEVDKLSPPILQLSEVTFHYSKAKPIFNLVDISANMESRIAIVGENGAGKSTLLKLLIGDLEPVKGYRHIHRNLKIGYFSQHHIDQLDMNVSSVELLASRFPSRPAEQYRQVLGSFGITGDLALQTVDSLSGGQKSRVAFALMSMHRPNFLILDEPTNHLDIETVDALSRALKKFQGGVVLVSHDEELIRRSCTELWACKDSGITTVEGGFDEYRRILQVEFESQGEML